MLTPLVQRRAVSSPPALSALAVVGLGGLFGIYGVLFGMPLLLVMMILVWMLYVEADQEETAGPLNAEPPP